MLTQANRGGRNVSRQSNMELLRILAMFLVLFVHVNFYALGEIQSHRQVAEAPLSSFVRIEFESLALVCVNLFVLLSGFFGIRPKAKGVANLLFQFFFWRLLLVAVSFFTGDFAFRAAVRSLIPGTIPGDWFIPCYLLLMMLAPALNAFVENTPKALPRFLIIFFAVQTLFGWLFPYWPYNNGYSLISFIGIYMLGRYVHLHLDGKFVRAFTPYCGIGGYVLCATVAAAGCFGLIWLDAHERFSLMVSHAFMRYSSPFNVAGATLLLVAFSHFRFSNALVNRLAQSAFVVYIVHLTPSVWSYYQKVCQWLYSELNVMAYFGCAVLFCVLVYLACAVVDTARIYLWKQLSRRMFAGGR